MGVLEGVFKMSGKVEINRCEQIEILNELISRYFCGRRLVIWNFDRNEKVKSDIRKYFENSNYTIAAWFNSFEENDVKVKDFLKKNRNNLYVIVWGEYANNIDNILNECRFEEVKDYIYKTHKLVKIGGNIRNYSDDYGNKISYLPANLEIYIYGYSNKISIAFNSSFGTNSKLFVYSNTCIEIKDKAKFGANTTITLKDSSLCLLESSHYSNNIELFCRAGIINIGNNGNFLRNFTIISEDNCTVSIGDEALMAPNCYIRAGDGHSLFDVKTGKKRNYQKGLERNKIIIGNHVWIGYDNKILNPTTIGSGCNSGSGSIIRGNYPNNCSLVGSIARVVKKDSAWAGHPLATDMTSSCGNSYAVPTIDLSKVTNHELLEMREITDIYSYLSKLGKVKNRLFVIAVKDTSGYKFDTKMYKLFTELCLKTDLRNLVWRGYIVINTEERVYEFLGEKDMPLAYEIVYNNFPIKVLSNPLHAGNSAEIYLGNYNYSVNLRGLNIVIYDKESMQIVDSVCFDTHVQELTCTRKILTC